MCVKKQFRYCPSEIDGCMKSLISNFNVLGVETLACCCGHGKYAMTIVVRWHSKNLEICSSKIINRKKLFYRKDKEGFYYIPECV